MILVFTTSAGVLMVDAINPEQPLQKSDKKVYTLKYSSLAHKETNRRFSRYRSLVSYFKSLRKERLTQSPPTPPPSFGEQNDRDCKLRVISFFGEQ